MAVKDVQMPRPGGPLHGPDSAEPVGIFYL